MKVLFSVFITGLLFVFSCKSTEQIHKNLLTLTTYPSYSVAYNYDNNGRLSSQITTSSNDTLVYVVSYDSHNNIIKLTATNRYANFAYDANNRLVTEEDYLNDTIQNKTAYEYNSSGQVSKTTLFGLNNGQLESGGYKTYEYQTAASKNPFSIKQYYPDNTLAFQWTYEYDDKYLPFANSLELLKLHPIGANNVVKITQVSGGIPGESIYSYTYSDKQFPVTESYPVDQLVTFSYNYR